MAANKIFWWDAPKGFKAVKADTPEGESGSDPCNRCYFKYEYGCLGVDWRLTVCISEFRKDKQDVIFIKRENHVQ